MEMKEIQQKKGKTLVSIFWCKKRKKNRQTEAILQNWIE